MAAVAVLYLIFTWAAWHIAIAWGGHTITYTTMIICAAGCLAAAGEALPRAPWPQRAAAALTLVPTLPVIVLPIGGLLLLQQNGAGKYTLEETATGCTLCAMGKHQEAAGQTSCDACAASAA